VAFTDDDDDDDDDDDREINLKKLRKRVGVLS